jgi:soluble cytochrome b562
MIERNILIGLITSTEYIQRIYNIWNIDYIESPTAKRMATWVITYYEKYKVAPNKDIELIFDTKKAKLPKELAEEIEQDILPSLSEEFEENSINVDYLVAETKLYFDKRHLIIHSDTIRSLTDAGKLEEAKIAAATFNQISKEFSPGIDLSNEKVFENIDQAFKDVADPLIKFPGPLGDFLNEFLVKGGFVAFMSIREKIGKTYWMIEMAMRAARAKKKVAFFSAGDMSENELIMRIAIHLARKSNKAKYCGKMWEPVKDCIFNQNNSCTKKERECYFGVFDGAPEKTLREEITKEELIEVAKLNPDYSPCTNCKEFEKNKWGTVWMQEVDVGDPLTADKAKKLYDDFFIKHKRSFKISTHPSNTLTVAESCTIMEVWEKEENFVPDIVMYDYPDIMTEDQVKEFRHKQNQIWMNLRGVSQKKSRPLTIIVTQGDAEAYDRDLLRMKNFSEDKRKYAHPTAFAGLNQDRKGREKDLGILRINIIVAREGDFNSEHVVHIIQNLKRGRPYLGSYY